jgi:hypothetical protein
MGDTPTSAEAPAPDIVERLRKAKPDEHCNDSLCAEAADTITALRAENERLVKSRNKWGQKYNKALAHQKELYAQLTEQAAESEKLRNDVRLAVMSDSKECTAISEVNARLTAENERLRAALEKIDVGEGWAALIARAALKEDRP